MLKKNKLKGFAYRLTPEKIKAYRNISQEKRLLWLYYGNVLRHNCPEKIIKLQDDFRQAVI